MRDTLEVFGVRLAELRELWRAVVAPQLTASNAKLVARASEGLFGELNDDIRRAAEISRGRALSPEAIQQTCRYGWSKVFQNNTGS